MSKKLHVVFISSWFPSAESPFNGNFVLRHAEAVSEFADVSFINVSKDPLPDKTQLGISSKIRIYESHLKKIRVALISSPIFIIQKLFHLKRLFNKLTDAHGKPDVIHCNVIYPGAFYAWFLKILTKTPFIVSEHWTGYLYERKAKVNYFRLLTIKLLAKKASMICPVSDYLKDSMISLKIKGNYHVVPNVVNTELFKIHETRDRDEIFHFLHISSLIEKHKNISGLINTIHSLSKRRKDFKLNIITCSSDRSREKLIKEKGLDCFVDFHYSLSPEQIASFFSKSQAFVLFSNFETFGVVLIESFASGVPVIGTNIKPINDLIKPERGILVEPRNEKELEDAMLALIDEKNTFNKNEIRQYAVQNYSYKIVGQQFLNLYHKAIEII